MSKPWTQRYENEPKPVMSWDALATCGIAMLICFITGASLVFGAFKIFGPQR